jgi:hypothetical protein
MTVARIASPAYRARAAAMLSMLPRQTTATAMTSTQRLAHRLYEPVTRSIPATENASASIPATENRKCVEEDDQSENGVEHSAVGHSVQPLVAAHPIAAPHDAATPGSAHGTEARDVPAGTSLDRRFDTWAPHTPAAQLSNTAGPDLSIQPRSRSTRATSSEASRRAAKRACLSRGVPCSNAAARITFMPACSAFACKRAIS